MYRPSLRGCPDAHPFPRAEDKGTAAEERLRDMTAQHKAAYADVVLVDKDKKPLRRGCFYWVARKRHNETGFRVKSDGYLPDSAEHQRFVTIVELVLKFIQQPPSIAARSGFPWGIGRRAVLDYEFLQTLDAPLVVGREIQDLLAHLAGTLSRKYPRNADLAFVFLVPNVLGQCDRQLWYKYHTDETVTLDVLDITEDTRRARHCREAATIVMSYKLAKLLPHRDMRVLLGVMIWNTRAYLEWKMDDAEDIGHDDISKKTKVSIE